MMNFFMGGGFSMSFVALLGLVTLMAAIRFLRAPASETVGSLRALSAATAFASFAGFAANIAAVCQHVPGNPKFANDPQVGLIVLMGVGESLAPLILGFGLLAAAWLAAALGGRSPEAVADKVALT